MPTTAKTQGGTQENPHNVALDKQRKERTERQFSERQQAESERHRAARVADALTSRPDTMPYLKDLDKARQRLKTAAEKARAAAARVLTVKEKLQETETRRKAIAAQATELAQEAARLRAAVQVGEASPQDLKLLAKVEADIEAVPVEERKGLRRLETELEKRLVQATIDFQPLLYDREDAEHNILVLEADELSARIAALQAELRATENRILALNQSRRTRTSTYTAFRANGARNVRAKDIARRYTHIAAQEVAHNEEG